jgi:mannose-6-phosphate isomerase-like protein (cupin superfamily)
MKISLADILGCIPGAASIEWPQGERYAEAFAHGSMSVGLYAPVGADPQTPHAQDEIYIIRTGSAEFMLATQLHPCTAGDVLFVAAGLEHRFQQLSNDFCAWVVFWGPTGGEHGH